MKLVVIGAALVSLTVKCALGKRPVGLPISLMTL